MKVLLRKEYMDYYDLRMLIRLTNQLFDNYNYRKFISEDIYFSSEKKTYSDVCVQKTFSNGSPVEKAVDYLEKSKQYMNYFDRRINLLLEDLTEDEYIVYKYGVLERRCDSFIKDKMCKTDKTYYPIKKSCYLKIVLTFHLLSETQTMPKKVFDFSFSDFQ